MFTVLHFITKNCIIISWISLQKDIVTLPIPLLRLFSISSIFSSISSSGSSAIWSSELGPGSWGGSFGVWGAASSLCSGLGSGLNSGSGLGSGSGSGVYVVYAAITWTWCVTDSSARLLLLDPAATLLLELLQMDLAGSESSILWLRSESSAGVEALGAGSRVLSTGTGTQGARTDAVGTEVEITGSGDGVGGGAGAFRFLRWLCGDGELRFIYRGRQRTNVHVWIFRTSGWFRGVAMQLLSTECFLLVCGY